ncbi:MAG: hypothetical protein ACRDRU_18800, partial [Pseudonocardiaceae bacterium]
MQISRFAIFVPADTVGAFRPITMRAGAVIGAFAIVHGGTTVGEQARIEEHAIVGKPELGYAIGQIYSGTGGITMIGAGTVVRCGGTRLPPSLCRPPCRSRRLGHPASRCTRPPTSTLGDQLHTGGAPAVRAQVKIGGTGRWDAHPSHSRRTSNNNVTAVLFTVITQQSSARPSSTIRSPSRRMTRRPEPPCTSHTA